jgi:RimJ/RimL family protein N-acetyltransferase
VSGKELPLPDPPLADDLVTLRPYRPGDARALVAELRDPEIPRWTVIPAPYTDRDAHRFLARLEPGRRAGRELALAIVATTGGRLLGGCGLINFDHENGRAEIGYWVARDARRRGVGTRTVVLLSRWALRTLDLERLELLANPGNEASQRLAERAGFTREGLLRSYRPRKGVREDFVMFSLLASEL